MPSLMPSLFKYFTVVGAVLVVGLIGLNAVLEPGGPGPSMVKPQPKARSIRHDPGASLVERLRAEEAAQKAVMKDEANVLMPQPVTVAAPATPAAASAAPARPVQLVTQAAAQPAPVAVEPAQSAPAALIGVPTQEEAARATRLAQEKIAADKARKKRIARERSRTKAIQEASAARQQDQIYYGYAPRPTYGPFGQGGGQGGGGWNRGW